MKTFSESDIHEDGMGNLIVITNFAEDTKKEILDNQDKAKLWDKLEQDCDTGIMYQEQFKNHQIAKHLGELGPALKKMGDEKIDKSDLYEYGYIMASFVWSQQVQKILRDD